MGQDWFPTLQAHSWCRGSQEDFLFMSFTSSKVCNSFPVALGIKFILPSSILFQGYLLCQHYICFLQLNWFIHYFPKLSYSYYFFSFFSHLKYPPSSPPSIHANPSHPSSSLSFSTCWCPTHLFNSHGASFIKSSFNIPDGMKCSLSSNFTVLFLSLLQLVSQYHSEVER